MEKVIIPFFLSLTILSAQGKDTILFIDLFDRDTLGSRWQTYGTPNAYPWWGIDTVTRYQGKGSLADSPFRNWTKESWSWAKMTYGMNFADLLSAQLVFYQQRNMQSGRGWGYVEVSTDLGQNWTSLGTYQGQSNWERTVVDLNNYLNLPDVQIRFYLLVADNANPNFDGWFIDSVVVRGTKRICRDVGPFKVLAPGDTVRIDSTVFPQVQVVNYGNTQESLWVYLNISYKGRVVYSESSWINLERGGASLADFSPFTFDSLGLYHLLSWTSLPGDTFYYNDTLRDSTWVISYTHDVGTEAILSPRGNRYPGRFRLMAIYKNYGLSQEAFYAYFRIISNEDTILKRSTSLQLHPDSSREVDFGDTTLRAGEYKVVAYTYLADDERPDNNLKEDSLRIFAFPYDVGIDRIMSPAVTNNFDTIIPRALVYNLGTQTATFSSHFKIFNLEGNKFYSDSLLVINLPADSVREIAFSPWMPDRIGRFFANCSLHFPEDENPENDTLTKYFTVLIGGWLQRENLPLGPKKKGVSSGGSLTYLPDTFVYALKGNNTNEFYRYNIYLNQWQPLCSIPWQGEKRKNVKGGASLTSNLRDRVFALKGNKTDEFWSYFPDGDSWKALRSVPPIPKSGVKDGAGLCYFVKGDSEFVFFLKGTKTYLFSAYYVPEDTWLERADAPAGPYIKKWGKGSCLTTDGELIYALKGGGKYNEFYCYYPMEDTWVERCSLPQRRGGAYAKKKKVKDGASLCSDRQTGIVYAFKGGNTDEFWSYDPNTNRWRERDPLPSEVKRIKRGSALTFADFRAFAFKGNKTLEFWMFLPIETTGYLGKGLTQEGANLREVKRLDEKLLLFPNPTSGIINILASDLKRITLSLFSACGKKIPLLMEKTKNGFRFNLKDLPPGAYFLLVKKPKERVFYKVIKR